MPTPVVVRIVGLEEQHLAFARDRINGEINLAIVDVVAISRRNAAATGLDDDVQRVQRPQFGRDAVICRDGGHLAHQHAVDQHLRDPVVPSHHRRWLAQKIKHRMLLNRLAVGVV